MKLEGKVAIVTGGARGNGFATARLMAEEGADIVIADICENMETIPYDMSTEESMKEAVEEIVDEVEIHKEVVEEVEAQTNTKDFYNKILVYTLVFLLLSIISMREEFGILSNGYNTKPSNRLYSSNGI